MFDFLNPHMLDLIALAVSMAMFTGYNLYVWCRLRRDSIYTIQGATNLARRAWVMSIMEEEGKDILAVQTLRNSTMAATFLASTAILLSVGVLNLTSAADKFSHTWHTVNVLGSTEQSTLALKLLVLLINLFIAFFSFSSSIRLYNHVGFMINTPCSEDNYGSSITFVAIQLNRAASHFHHGMLAYYYMVPLVFWFFGPLFLVGSTVVMIAVVYFIDRSPRMNYDYLSRDERSCLLRK